MALRTLARLCGHDVPRARPISTQLQRHAAQHRGDGLASPGGQLAADPAWARTELRAQQRDHPLRAPNRSP